MPLTRYRVRSEYGLADPELYRAADKDDPEALLEGVAMAGLVGVLRQLGDLAEFAAEIFHDLHEEVMTTSARGHGLMVRVQQLEAEFPPIEKALLTQPMQSAFFYNAGSDWHPNLRAEQNLIARGDLPRFVMDSYEESRGPPRLFLLDKFDVAGAGACLKRYTNPSFFKVEPAAMEIPREKKNRRVKKKSMRWRNGETTPEVVPLSHTKLHQLFLEERIENGDSDPARLVKLKKRHLNGFVVDSKTGRNYMEKFAETPSDRETPSAPASFTPEYTHESGIRILEISTVSSAEKSTSQSSGSSKRSRNGYDEGVNDKEIIKLADTCIIDEPFERSSSSNEVEVEKQLTVYGEEKPKVIANGYESDDVGSEVDNYMDALANIESEVETDNEYRPDSTMNFLKAESYRTGNEANDDHLERPAQHSDTQSVGNFSTSDDGNNSFKKNSSRFSYCDSPRSFVENTPSDSDAGSKVFASTDTCVVEISDKATIELSRTADCYNAADSEVLRTVENGTDCFDSETGHSRSWQINNDFTKKSERDLVDGSEDEDPNGANLSNLSKSAHEIERRDESELHGFEAQDEPDIASKNALSYENGTPTNELPNSWAHSDIVNPDSVHTELDNSVTDIEAHTEELSPAVDSAKSDLSNDIPDEQQFQDRSEDVPQVEHVSAEAETRFSSENRDTEVTCKTVDFEEMDSFGSEVNKGSEGTSEVNNEHLDHKRPETADIDGENGSVLPSNAVCSPSQSPIVLHEPLVSSVVDYKKEVEYDEGISRAADVDIEALGEPQIQNPQICKFAFVDFGLSKSVSASDSHCTPTICDSTGDLPSANETLNNSSQVSSTLISTLEDSDTSSPEPEASEDSVKSLSDQVGSQYPVTGEVGPRPEILFEQSEVRADQVHEEHAELDQASMQTSILSFEEMGIGERDDRVESKTCMDQELHVNDSLLSTSISANEEGDRVKEASNPFEPAHSSVTTIEEPRDDIGDLPPLPPLPPMQWRSLSGIGMGLFPHNPFESNTDCFPSVLPSQDRACQPQHLSSRISFGEDENAVHHDASDQGNNATLDEPLLLNPFVTLPEISSERDAHDELAVERVIAQTSSSSFSPALTSEAMATENHDMAQMGTQDAGLDSRTEEELKNPAVTSEPTPNVQGPVRLGLLMPEGETTWLSSNDFGMMPESEAGKPNGSTTNKLPRPRNPLIDAVNAHGKSKLRKVAERVRPQLGPKADERDSMLEQIRTKSFNLKPAAAVTRPSIPGPNPKANLKVAAILEKANAIRQALAGSDDEDDDDNWD